MTSSDLPVFHFSGLTLDVPQGRLIGPTGDIALRPKSFALLCHLARNAGRVISKDELIAAVWPDVIVTDDSLTQCIHELRTTLGPARADLLKTIPRRGYLFANAMPADQSHALPHHGSIAIMPFVSLTPISRGDQLLFDGLVNDIISHLARLRSLHVIARGSTFALRHMASDARRIANTLGVAYVVTGTLEARGNNFCLHVDLVQTQSGAIVWTDAVNIRKVDILTILDTLTQQITTSVAAQITTLERHLAALVPEQSLDAWQAYHLGLDHVFRFDPVHATKALGYFNTATSLDPNFTRAYAGASFCHYFFAFSGMTNDRDAAVQSALRMADKAMQVDDANPTSQWSFARALWLNGDSDTGLHHARQAVSLSPSFAHARYTVGFIEAHHGDPQLAVDQIDKTESLSPLDPFLASMQLTRAVALTRLRNFDQAALWARKATRHHNVYPQMRSSAALVLAAAGYPEEARAIFTALRKSDPGYSLNHMFPMLHRPSSEIEALFRHAASDIGL